MEMKKVARTASALLLPALFAWVAIAGSPALAQSQAQGAKADLKDTQGQLVGTAVFSPDPSGVKLQVQVNGFAAAAAGEHGIHIHTTGKCEAAAFTSAGGHFNPNSKKHGLNSPEGRHAGDMPNIAFDAAGNATYETVVEGVT